MLADIDRLIHDRRFDQMEAFVLPTGPGSWLYLLEAVGFHRHGSPPDDARLLKGLADVRDRIEVTDFPFLTWSSRVPTDLPRRPNPWIDLVLPRSQAQKFVEEVQATIAPIAAGDVFSLLLIPIRPPLHTRPLFRVPNEETAIGFDTLRALPAGVDVKSALAFNRRLYDRCHELGGTQYPISAVELDADDWARHYGEQWERLLAAKHRFDRHDVLASGPDVLGRVRNRAA
jgi:hypothetical protein